MSLSHCLLAVLAMALWGFNLVVIKIGLVDIPPLLLCAGRFILLSLPAVFFVKKPPIPFRKIVWYGLIMFALQYGLLFLGMGAGISAGLASIILQLQVFFTILLGILFFGEHMHIWQTVGALVSFSGMAVIALNLGGSATILGFVLIILAGFAWGTGNVISKKSGQVRMGSLIVWASTVAWPPLLALSLVMDGPDQVLSVIQQMSWESTAAVLYIAFAGTLVTFCIWSWLLHHHPLGTVAPFTLLVPVFGILSSVLVLGEPLPLWKIAGAVLVITGLGVNLFGPKLFSRRT